MTNVLAAIVVTVGTNWISHGVMIKVDGTREHVQRAQVVTNVTAIIEWEKKRHEMVLENTLGPISEIERRTPLTPLPPIPIIPPPPPLPPNNIILGPGPRLNVPNK